MRDYFRKLEERVRKYSRKYANRPRKAALRLAFWNLICCFRSQVGIPVSVKKSLEKKKMEVRHHIAVRLCGGIGDQLVGCNYLFHLAKKFPELRIDVYARKEMYGRFICSKMWNGELMEPVKTIPEKYDAVIQLDRYPHIISLNGSVLPQLGEFEFYVERLQNFKQRYSRFFDYGTRLDGMTAILSTILGKKRIHLR